MHGVLSLVFATVNKKEEEKIQMIKIKHYKKKFGRL